MPDTADPFGLWNEEPAWNEDSSEAVSFGLPGEATLETAAVWRVTGEADLEKRAQKVQAVGTGLLAAENRLSALLVAPHLAAKGEPGQVSFGIGSPVESPESRLLLALAPQEPGEQVSFGLTDHLPDLNWDEMQAKFQQLMEAVNRQLLHFVWVDTCMGGQVVARTTVNWGGDMETVWLRAARPEQMELHRRSLALAMESRRNSLKTVTTVATTATRLALAFSTPLGATQLLALSWQFINEVIVPFLQNES